MVSGPAENPVLFSPRLVYPFALRGWCTVAVIMISNDILADRRYDFARMLKERGDLEGALSLFEEAAALVPGWAPAEFALAETLEALGRHQEAAAHYTQYLRLAETDEMGAEIRLALIGSAPVPKTLPEAYVRSLFDQYAPRFEESLLANLDYKAPFQLLDAIERLRPQQPSGERVLDLGCGTGLAGEAFRKRAAWLVGVDLSPGMIAEAGRKTIYDELHVADAVAGLAGRDGFFDLIVAADVLVYIGDLAPVFRAALAAIRPDGLFAFSVQRTDDTDFILGAECRYSHRADYVRAVAADVGFDVTEIAPAVSRVEAGKDVPGLIAVLRRRTAITSHPDLPELAALERPLEH